MRLTKKIGALAAVAFTVLGGSVAALAQEGGRARLLEKYDTNHDGTLDANEKAAMREQMRQMREKRHAAMLARFDVNKDGKLDPGERKAMIDTLATERFKKLDANGDGVVSLDEFRAAAATHRHRFGFGLGGFGAPEVK
jgi:Ca2+-binding EF-hand superfamily protein